SSDSWGPPTKWIVMQQEVGQIRHFPSVQQMCFSQCDWGYQFACKVDSEAEMKGTEASHHKLSNGSSSINLNITSSPIEGDYNSHPEARKGYQRKRKQWKT
ncbi:unnamed protein product, partial [Brassica oleracea var. botrytis]